MAKKPQKATMTAKEARDFESRSLNRARGGTNKPAGKPTLTPSERGGFETKSLKQSRVNPKVTSTPKPTSTAPASTAARQVAKKGLGRIAAAALGPVAGAVATGLGVGEMLKGTRPAKAAAEKLTGLMAKATGLERMQNQMLSGNGALQAPRPRSTSTAPGGTSPAVPSKTVSEAPKPTTPKGSTSPAPKKAPKPSQKVTGASKGQGRAMKGAELANFLGLSSSSAVRTYMETGKHKYPSKKK